MSTQFGSRLSSRPSQSSSTPLPHHSGAPGYTPGSKSLQSSSVGYPSPSTSFGWQRPVSTRPSQSLSMPSSHPSIAPGLTRGFLSSHSLMRLPQGPLGQPSPSQSLVHVHSVFAGSSRPSQSWSRPSQQASFGL